jgi:hypothetical protein
MSKLSVLVVALAAGVIGMCPPAFCQDLPRLGIAVKMSTLGAGIEAATAVTRRSNVRVGFNAFSYSKDFNKDGATYSSTLTLRSLEVHYDQYLVAGLHVSPGLLAYNGNRGDASVTVPGGQSFQLGGVTYFSSQASPVAGTATLDFGRKVAPAIFLGYGNLLPRSKRRFTVNFDVGVVFQGSPNAALNLSGSTCNSLGSACQSIGSNPGIQANIQAQEDKFNKNLRPFKYYPVISLSFGYKIR